ncbi:hypothetical protein D3C75_1022100 [compost metagenome]
MRPLRRQVLRCIGLAKVAVQIEVAGEQTGVTLFQELSPGRGRRQQSTQQRKPEKTLNMHFNISSFCSPEQIAEGAFSALGLCQSENAGELTRWPCEPRPVSKYQRERGTGAQPSTQVL